MYREPAAWVTAMNTIELLHHAVRSNDRDALCKLYSKGADLNCVYYGTTPLISAIENGKSSV